ESIKTDYLGRERQMTFKRLVAEGVARLFEENPVAASVTFDKAEEWIRARNREKARVWYLQGASLAAAPMAAFLFWLVRDRDWWQGMFVSAHLFDFVAAVCAGGVGAWLSVNQRARSSELDISAGMKLHQTEGLTRVLIGAVGAALFALAIKAG